MLGVDVPLPSHLDVSVLYARSSAARLPAGIEKALQPMAVWWDKKIASGDYRRAITNAIDRSACVIPIWSDGAPESAVLADELRYAKSKGVSIIPLSVSRNCAPLGYGTLQTIDIPGWDGSSGRKELKQLRARVIQEVRAVRGNWEHPEFEDKTNVRRPAFFYSVSSHETKVRPIDALQALRVFGAKHILISAYDFYGQEAKKLISVLSACRKKGATVVLDSGNYERYRRDDSKWTYGKYRYAVRNTPHDLVFTYDEIEPPKGHRKISAAVSKEYERDVRLTSKPLIPIIHLPKTIGEELEKSAALITQRVANSVRPIAIAIPERELGEGLFARVRTMRSIRNALNELPFYQPVHLLGTGTPISVALLTAAGADSFDGLEWCRYVADASQSDLHHFQLYEMFKWQDAIPGVNEITRAAASDEQVRYTGKVVFHNLDFYSSWMNRFRLVANSNAGLSSFLAGMLEKSALATVKDALPEVFDEHFKQ